MSALPKQVQVQIDLANKIAEEMKAAMADPAAAAPAEDVEPTEAAEPAAEPAAKEKPSEPSAASPTPDETPDEHKYKVLQGKYNKEVPRLQDQLRKQDSIIQDLRQQINNTQALLATMKATSAEPAKKVEDLITQDEIDQFGPDLIDLVKRVAKQSVLPEVESRLKPLDNRFKQVEQSASNTQKSVARSEREKVLDSLSRAVPNWPQLNEDPDFIDWLDQVDPYSGQVRGELLNTAMQHNNAERVIRFFEGFQNENATVTSTTSQDAPQAAEPHRKLDEFVAPGTPKTGTVSAPNESGKRVWTRKDVSALYAKKNEFVKNRQPIPKELVNLERDLIKAQREGRLR